LFIPLPPLENFSAAPLTTIKNWIVLHELKEIIVIITVSAFITQLMT